MHAPVALLRGMAAAISLLSAHMLGRDIAAKRPVLRWALRYALSVAAICYLGVDWLAIAVLGIGAGLFALGWWLERHPKPPEDLTKKMFDDEEDGL